MKKRLASLVGLGSIAAVALCGCSLAGNTHQSGPANVTDKSPANVSQMPSGFTNVADKCIVLAGQGYGVFVASDNGKGGGRSVSVVPDNGCTVDGVPDK